jgi:hypothetical protein
MDCGGESGYGHRDMKRESIVEKHRKRRIQRRRIVGGLKGWSSGSGQEQAGGRV